MDVCWSQFRSRKPSKRAARRSLWGTALPTRMAKCPLPHMAATSLVQYVLLLSTHATALTSPRQPVRRAQVHSGAMLSQASLNVEPVPRDVLSSS
jgi:hypothetical protein